jgi:hypothetical protein
MEGKDTNDHASVDYTFGVDELLRCINDESLARVLNPDTRLLQRPSRSRHGRNRVNDMNALFSMHRLRLPVSLSSVSRSEQRIGIEVRDRGRGDPEAYRTPSASRQSCLARESRL